MSNGLTYHRLKQEGLSCLAIEMYFSGFPKFIGLQNFPNLQTLCLVAQTISVIEGLKQLPKLKELWVVECNLKVSIILNIMFKSEALDLYIILGHNPAVDII